jgi:hypothetical protein
MVLPGKGLGFNSAQNASPQVYKSARIPLLDMRYIFFLEYIISEFVRVAYFHFGKIYEMDPRASGFFHSSM